MNKYVVRIPYSYSRYGTMSANIYADDEEDALSLAYDSSNRYFEDYDDHDDDSENDYDYSDMTVEIEQHNVDPPNDNNSSNTPTQNSFQNYPNYFLENLPRL